MNNIKIDVATLEWEGIDMIHLIQDTDRLQAAVNRAINFKVKKNPKTFLNDIETLSFSRKTLRR